MTLCLVVLVLNSMINFEEKQKSSSVFVNISNVQCQTRGENVSVGYTGRDVQNKRLPLEGWSPGTLFLAPCEIYNFYLYTLSTQRQPVYPQTHRSLFFFAINQLQPNYCSIWANDIFISQTPCWDLCAIVNFSKSCNAHLHLNINTYWFVLYRISHFHLSSALSVTICQILPSSFYSPVHSACPLIIRLLFVKL